MLHRPELPDVLGGPQQVVQPALVVLQPEQLVMQPAADAPGERQRLPPDFFVRARHPPDRIDVAEDPGIGVAPGHASFPRCVLMQNAPR